MGKKLAAVLALGVLLSGCGAEPSGDQPTQVTVQSGLVSFQEGTVTVTPEDVAGTWMDPEGNTTLSFDSRGTVTVEKRVNGEYVVEQLSWTVDDQGLSILDSEGGKLDYKVVEQNGQIQIMGSGSTYTSVEQESMLSQEIHFLGIGETAATDLVKLTLTGIEFAPAVSLREGEYLLPDPSGDLAAQPGDLMACMSFRVQNLMDEGLAEQDFCNLDLEYDHTDHYSQGYYGVSGAAVSDLEAGAWADCRVCIECAEAVAVDNDFSLCVNLTLPGTEGEVHFTYVLK